MKPVIKKRIKISIISIIAILFIAFMGIYIYSLDYYRADDTARQMVATQSTTIEHKGNQWVFHPDKENNLHTAFIFYPGAKVEAIAYAPLLENLAKNGITCILVKMPFNLAVFGINEADGIYEDYEDFSDIQNWYIGGHSLGGAMASSYAAKNSNKLNGLILMGAYPTKQTALSTVAIYGSQDMVLHKDKLDGVENKIEIVGGNHAGFGNYGDQKGDGTATITKQEQQEQTVQVILKFIAGAN